MKKWLFLALCFALYPLVVVAQGFAVPEGDVAAVLLNLAMNYKTLGVVGILSAATLVTVQALKTFAPDAWPYKRLTVLGVSVLYSLFSGLLVPGSSFPSVMITVFLTSGGAVALYEALKGAGILKK